MIHILDGQSNKKEVSCVLCVYVYQLYINLRTITTPESETFPKFANLSHWCSESYVSKTSLVKHTLEWSFLSIKSNPWQIHETGIFTY